MLRPENNTCCKFFAFKFFCSATIKLIWSQNNSAQKCMPTFTVLHVVLSLSQAGMGASHYLEAPIKTTNSVRSLKFCDIFCPYCCLKIFYSPSEPFGVLDRSSCRIFCFSKHSSEVENCSLSFSALWLTIQYTHFKSLRILACSKSPWLNETTRKKTKSKLFVKKFDKSAVL